MFLAAPRWLKTGVNILLWATFGLVLAALVWGLDKGFDVTDEAYYLLGMQPAQEKLTTFTALQFTLISRVFGWLNDIIAFRVLSLVVTLAAAACFAWGFLRLVHRLYPEPLPIAPAALGAWLAGGSFFVAAALTLTFSYNVFINAILLAQAGLAFYALAKPELPGTDWRRRAAWTGIGGLGLLGLLVKPPAALAILIVLLAGGFAYSWPHRRKFFKEAILPCLAGGLAGLVLAMALGVLTPILTTLDSHILHPGHSPKELLKSLWGDFINFASQLARAWLPIGAALAVGVWSAWRRRTGRALAAWEVLLASAGVLAAVLLSPLLESIRGNWMRLPVIYVWTALLAMLAGLLLPNGFAVSPWRLDPHAGQKAALYAMLFFLPLATAFGTNNTLVWQAWLHISPWMALLFLAFLETQQFAAARPLGWVVLAFAAVWVCAGWMNTYFMLPYRLLQNRLSQIEPLAVRSAHFRGLKVDPTTKAFFENYDAILAAARTPPGGIIAIYDMPGLVYLSDGVSPGDIWYQEGDDRSLEIAGYIRESQTPRKSSLILMSQPWSELPAAINAALSEPEIDFPAAYRQIGRFDDPMNKRNVTLYERRR